MKKKKLLKAFKKLAKTVIVLQETVAQLQSTETPTQETDVQTLLEEKELLPGTGKGTKTAIRKRTFKGRTRNGELTVQSEVQAFFTTRSRSYTSRQVMQHVSKKLNKEIDINNLSAAICNLVNRGVLIRTGKKKNLVLYKRVTIKDQKEVVQETQATEQ